MTAADFLKHLCEGYVRSYREFNLRGNPRSYQDLDPQDSLGADTTHRELDFFGRLGEMLGFVAHREMGRRDLSWVDADSKEKKGKLVLCLERETLNKKAVEAMKKLLRTKGSKKAPLLVGVLGWVTEDQFTKVKQTIKDRLKGRSLLVLAWVGQNDEATPLRAIVASGGKFFTREGEGGRDKDDYWYARFTGPWRRRKDVVEGTTQRKEAM